MTALLLLQLAVAVPAEAVRQLTLPQICTTTWHLDRRHVTAAEKREVARLAGIPRSRIVARGAGPCCEFDHRIPRSLGGADVVANLQLQPWKVAVEKDRLEVALFRLVCAARIDLAAARLEMWNWHSR